MDENEVADAPLEEEVRDDRAKLSAIEAYEVERAAARRQWNRDFKCHRERLRQALIQENAGRTAGEARLLANDEIDERERASRAENEVAQRAFLDTIMEGPDVASWIAPKESANSDELLAEHLAQLRNVVRYALSMTFDDENLVQQRLSAANTATRMIRANIALAKELKTAKSKTVRGVERAGRTQD